LSVGIEEKMFFVFDCAGMKLFRDALRSGQKKFRAFGFEGERIIALDV